MDTQHIAKLANLPLTADEAQKLRKELEETIEFVNHLSEVNTKGVQPTSQVTGKTNEFREDTITPGLSQEEALKNAPKTHNGYFVSKVTWE